MAVATEIPSYITAGDTVVFKQYYNDYLPTSYTAKLILVNQSYRHVITATDNGDGYHLFTISAAVSVAIEPSEYKFFISVETGSDRITVNSGNIEVKPDYLTITGYDPRSHVKRVLDALEAVIEDKATDDQQAVMIKGRSITHFSPEELYKWRDKYRAEYNEELRREKIAKGLGNSSKIKVRFRD